MFKSTRQLATIMIACTWLIAANVSYAATFPERTVKFLVGYPAGGGTDFMARLVAKKLAEKWGQPVIVENREGAEGTIAADVVAHAKPDGYTLILITDNFTIPPMTYKLKYDPVTDFTPITELASTPQVILTNPSLPVNSLSDLISLAKSKPGKLNFGSSGTGTFPYMAIELLMNLTGANMVNISYKGNAPLLTALFGNEVQLMCGPVSTTPGLVKSGQVKALAVTSKNRVAVLPDVPTVAEAANLPGYGLEEWYGVLAPPGLPAEITTKLRDDMAEIMKSPDVKSTLADQAISPVSSSSADFATTIKDTIQKWTALEKAITVKY